MNMEEMDEFERDGIPRVSGCSTRALGISSIPSPFDHSQAKMARDGIGSDLGSLSATMVAVALSPYRDYRHYFAMDSTGGTDGPGLGRLGARLFPQNSELPAATRLSLYVLSRPVIPTRVHVI